MTPPAFKKQATKNRQRIINEIVNEYQLNKTEVENMLSPLPVITYDGWENNNSTTIANYLNERYPEISQHEFRLSVQKIKNNFEIY